MNRFFKRTIPVWEKKKNKKVYIYTHAKWNGQGYRGRGKKPRSNLEKKAKRSERAVVMVENIPVLLGRSVVDNRRQSSFTAVIGLAYSDAKCSCICMTQSRLSANPCATENREKRTELGLTTRRGKERETENADTRNDAEKRRKRRAALSLIISRLLRSTVKNSFRNSFRVS